MQNKILKIMVFSFVVFLGIFIIFSLKREPTNTTQDFKEQNVIKSYNISIPSGYLSYENVVNQINKWNKEAPEITEVGVYGKSSAQKEIYYIRVCGDKNKNLPKVLIMACIHGNEKIANATVMGVLGKILNNYGKDDKVTKLLLERDIYFVPIVSPDSFVNNTRHVDGVDPNRNFPYKLNPNVKSVPPIAALREFFIKHKFSAVISTHAYSRLYIYPYGYTASPCPDINKYKDLCGRMASLARYQIKQIHEIQTAQPYRGFEADWFYENGAFAIVAEVGLEFIPPESTIIGEVERNYDAYLLFVNEAPNMLK